MKKMFRYLGLLMGLLLWLTGCGTDQSGDGERKDLDFTVVESAQIPAELKRVIEQHKEEEMQIVFEDQDSLYAVRGYGEQNSGGYSISVDECWEGDQNIHIATTLIGPSQTEKISKDPSFPVIVVKLQNREKEVIFE